MFDSQGYGVRFECDLSVKVPSTVSFFVNDLQLWGLRLKSSKDVTFEISELEMSMIQKVGGMMSLLVESSHMRVHREMVYRSTEVGFGLHTQRIQLYIPQRPFVHPCA